MIRPLAADLIPAIQDHAKALAASARWELESTDPEDHWADIDAQRAYVALRESVSVWAKDAHTIVASVTGPIRTVSRLGATVTGEALDTDCGGDMGEYVWTHGRIDTRSANQSVLTWE